MSKVLDWSAIATVNFDDNRRKKQGILTGREMFAKAYERLAAQEDHQKAKREAEPVLKAALIQAITSRSIIKVLQSIQNPTEALGGIAKSNDEDDDGFYYGGNKAVQQAEAQMNAKYEEVMEVIPSGVELVFKSWDKQLGQFIFKASNGQDYAIYDKSVIMFKERAIENPGLYGLLFNTSLIKALE